MQPSPGSTKIVAMGIAVKLSDEVVREAQREGKVSARSAAKQIEHWASIGRIVEASLRVPEINALKRARDGTEALASPAARVAIEQVLELLLGDERSDVVAHVRSTGAPLYAAAPGHRGMVFRVAADGTRTLGRIVKRRFVPDAE